MKRSFSIVFVLVLALSLVAVGAVSAKAPDTGDRTGQLDLDVNFGAVLGLGDHQDIVWYGTVTFDHGEYGIVYYTETIHGVGKVVSHWEEEWEIYDNYLGLFTVAGGVLTDFNPLDNDPVVEGFDAGMTHWKKFTWLGNGYVEKAANEFAEWEGSRVHTEGSFNFAEGTGTGIVRFN